MGPSVGVRRASLKVHEISHRVASVRLRGAAAACSMQTEILIQRVDHE